MTADSNTGLVECDVCLCRVPSRDIRVLPKQVMCDATGAGFTAEGVYVTVRGTPPTDMAIADLAERSPGPWGLCPGCYGVYRNWLRREAPAAFQESRPLGEALGRIVDLSPLDGLPEPAGPAPVAASPSPDESSEPPQVSPTAPRPAAGPLRHLWIIPTLASAFVAATYLADGFESVVQMREGPTLFGSSMPQLHVNLDPRNGLYFAVGIVHAALSLVCFNAWLRGRTGEGPIDAFWIGGAGPSRRNDCRWYRRISYVVLLLGVIPASFVLGLLFQYETDPQAVARHAAEHARLNGISDTGGYLFIYDDRHSSLVSPLTPDLIRALREETIYDFNVAEIRGLAMPGTLPLVILCCLAIWSVWLRRRPDGQSAKSRAVFALSAVTALYGAIAFYVIGWMTGTQYGTDIRLFGDPAKFMPGLMYAIGGIRDFQWAVAFWLFAAGAVALLAGVVGNIAREGATDRARSGWSALIFVVAVSVICVIPFNTHVNAGSPVILWISLFLVLSGLLWRLSIPPVRPGHSS